MIGHVAESPGPLSAHFPKEVKVHFDSLTLDDIEEDVEKAEPEKDDVVEVAETPDDIEDTENVEKDDVSEDFQSDVENEEPAEDDAPSDAVAEDYTHDIEPSLEVHTSKSSVSEGEEVLYYEDAPTKVDSFSEMRKVHGVYVVPFSSPIIVQTPVVILKEPLSRSGILKVPGKFAKFIKKIEESILNATKSHKNEWFKEELDNNTIEEGFKSFLDGTNLKVKVDEDLASFDEHENLIDNDFDAPRGLRCILEASEISFGRSEFGVVFSMTQAQIVKPPKCKISKPRKTAETPYFE
jgi:hypothetical protein